MYVRSLYTCFYGHDGLPEDRFLTDPDWSQIEGLVRALDRYHVPFLWFYKHHLDETAPPAAWGIPDFHIIGGSGAYAMDAPVDGVSFCYHNSDGNDDTVHLWTSDQGFHCESTYVCHDVERVVQAARHFFDHGALDPRLPWKRLGAA